MASSSKNVFIMGRQFQQFFPSEPAHFPQVFHWSDHFYYGVGDWATTPNASTWKYKGFFVTFFRGWIGFGQYPLVKWKCGLSNCYVLDFILLCIKKCSWEQTYWISHWWRSSWVAWDWRRVGRRGVPLGGSLINMRFDSTV